MNFLRMVLFFSLLVATVRLTGADAPFPGSSSTAGQASASTAQTGCGADGATNGDRFLSAEGSAWKGDPAAPGWWWQVRFDAPRRVGSILQVNGDHPTLLRNSPRQYVWQWSRDGKSWRDLRGTRVAREQRTFRIHRVANPPRAQYLRLRIHEAEGAYPTLREVEVYDDPTATIYFPDWAVVVSSGTRYEPFIDGSAFLSLARECEGWEQIQGQQAWLGAFDEAFLAVEPRPLCAFLTGSFRDWCEVEREPWRGVQDVLKRGRLPMWASCGGAQALAILAETGVDREWDCPHCRDPQNPRLPIYTHIGHTAQRPCGDYSACVFERGPTRVEQDGDPAFQGLPGEFAVMQSHCGQIEWAPRGWEVVATGGAGARTRNQALRLKGRPIYAAQFHIEMPGTPDTARQIMTNFLALARGETPAEGQQPRRR
jgi:hypothetical protein